MRRFKIGWLVDCLRMLYTERMRTGSYIDIINTEISVLYNAWIKHAFKKYNVVFVVRYSCWSEWQNEKPTPKPLSTLTWVTGSSAEFTNSSRLRMERRCSCHSEGSRGIPVYSPFPVQMLKPFLTANWRYLAMLNFRIDPELLAPHVPAGTELDFYNHGTYVSVVGFLF